ncbi:MAG: response regulator transcription factor [Syntrophomonadaceae bacterium]
MINNLMIASGTYYTSRYNVKTDKLNVFISDDSPVVRVRLANMIADINGISLIGEAANVQDSIEKINQLRPDAVILDICMPGGSGIDVLKKVRQLNNSAVIIVLTNYPFPQYRKICMEAGADYFFDKSNEFHKVLEIFKNLASHQD